MPLTKEEIMKMIAAMPGNQAEYDFDQLKEIEDSPLKNKTVLFLGSSVTYGAASKAIAIGEYISKRMGCQMIKEAVSGTTLVDEKKDSYIARMKANVSKDEKIDLLICQLSTNDATQNKPLGSISETKDINAFDTKTIAGAIEYIIAYAEGTWHCPAAFYTGSHYDSENYEKMVQCLYKIKEKWNITILDLWNDPSFNAISDEARSLYMADPIHPTRAGYRDWWGPELEKQILEKF